MTPLDWQEDTGYWEDGVRSWTGSNPPFVADIRQEADGSFTWTARVEDSRGTARIDQGVTMTLEWAQQHATNAILWHARGN